MPKIRGAHGAIAAVTDDQAKRLVRLGLAEIMSEPQSATTESEREPNDTLVVTEETKRKPRKKKTENDSDNERG